MKDGSIAVLGAQPGNVGFERAIVPLSLGSDVAGQIFDAAAHGQHQYADAVPRSNAASPPPHLSGHRLRPIGPGQHAGSIAQHDKSAWILLDAPAVDRSGDGEIVVSIEHGLDAGAFAAFAEKLDERALFFQNF